MTFSEQILWLDDMRRLCREGYDIAKQNQKLSKSRDEALYWKEYAGDHWDMYLRYRSVLTYIGVYTGDNDFESDKKLWA